MVTQSTSVGVNSDGWFGARGYFLNPLWAEWSDRSLTCPVVNPSPLQSSPPTPRHNIYNYRLVQCADAHTRWLAWWSFIMLFSHHTVFHKEWSKRQQRMRTDVVHLRLGQIWKLWYIKCLCNLRKTSSIYSSTRLHILTEEWFLVQWLKTATDTLTDKPA